MRSLAFVIILSLFALGGALADEPQKFAALAAWRARRSRL